MRILIIRHGDPDYEHDSLTEKGWREGRLYRAAAQATMSSSCSAALA